MRRRIILFIGMLFCAGLLSCKDFQTNNLQFDQAKWKVDNYRLRGQMVNSLVTQEILQRKSCEDVIQILGEPNYAISQYIKYDIDSGAITARWLQKNSLIVVFDDQRRVTFVAVIDN